MAAIKKKRYEYKLTLGKDINGNVIRKSFYSTKNKSDAKKKAEEFRVQYEMEMCLCGDSTLKATKFADWSVYCLKMYKKPYVKANTYNGTYLAPLENHLIPYFGKMNVSDIRPIHIQNYINQASQKYSSETIKKDFNVLSLIFQTAVDNQLCAKSPIVKSIILPKHEACGEASLYAGAVRQGIQLRLKLAQGAVDYAGPGDRHLPQRASGAALGRLGCKESVHPHQSGPRCLPFG